MSLFNVDIEENLIKEHLKTYNKVTNISCMIVNEEGNVKCYEGKQYECCKKFQELKGSIYACSQAHLYASRQSEKIGEPYVFFCPSGLVHWAVPLVANGIFRGGIIGGPVQMEISEEYIVDEIIRTNNFNISNRGILQAYLKSVPIVDPEKVRYLSNMLYIIAKDIMEEEVRMLDDRKKFYKEQAALNEEIQYLKKKEDTDHISKYYPVELEKELVSKVKIGDKKGARTILNELLGHVLFYSGSNIEIIKARVLELTVVLSRAAVEGGGNLEMIFGLNLGYIQEVARITRVEELSRWIVKVLERFTDSMFNLENLNNFNIIQKAISYINENISENISLDAIAEYVYLSPSYFSRLFKKEMGVSFTDYLNKARVEESKKYLADIKLSMSDISNIIGFSDQSYYTKVFKKFEGLSPGQFRKMMDR